ncbi:MAG: pyruvate kinase [Endomicrobiia bacterium]
MVKTKIIATIGPATSNETVIRKMMLAGVDVVRLNFSHTSHDEIIKIINIIRNLNKKYRRKIKILGDLQGHRIRIGKIYNEIELKRNKLLFLTQEDVIGTSSMVYFDYKGSLRHIKKGMQIFIDDGKIALEVVDRYENKLKTKVIVGGILKQNKGVNIPQAKLDFGGISKKDIQDILFCKENNIDYIAQSFVRKEKDVLEVKNLLGKKSDCKVIAKIENLEAINNIDKIINVSDGIMIARGDLGVSLPIYKVPIIQKIIIKKCNNKKKFVITATQMLESMIDNPRPTRAEVSDVSNAVIDGTDFVMLSAETAIGKYPVETVIMMNNILKYTEKNLHKLRRIK